MEEYVDFSEPRVPNTAYDVPRTDERIECVNASLPDCKGQSHPHWVDDAPPIDPAIDDGGYGRDSYFDHAMHKDD